MTYDEIIEQLEITKSKIKEISRNEYGGESWNDDLDALTEAADIVADYSKATAQASEMSQKYEQPAMAVRRAAGLYTCPLCGKRTQVGHTHCHWCGKKLSWDREAYADLARELRHSEGAVKRRILDLKIDKRPVRVPSRKWTEEEIETLCKMVDQGYDFTLIAEKLNRTALATRGKYERLQNPEYNRRCNCGQNENYEYQGIRSISGKDILKDRELMDGAEFQELEQVEGGENDGVYMQAMRSTV